MKKIKLKIFFFGGLKDLFVYKSDFCELVLVEKRNNEFERFFFVKGLKFLIYILYLEEKFLLVKN